MFLASFFIMPAIIVRIRADYFAHDRRPPSPWARQHPVIRLTLHVAKNILGSILLIAGIAMLALPGQGLLTIIIGFFLIDFPGKYRFERWLVSKPAIHRPLNWLRRRRGREPLRVSQETQ
jgi:hypothetical protein